MFSKGPGLSTGLPNKDNGSWVRAYAVMRFIVNVVDPMEAFEPLSRLDGEVFHPNPMRALTEPAAKPAGWMPYGPNSSDLAARIGDAIGIHHRAGEARATCRFHPAAGIAVRDPKTPASSMVYEKLPSSCSRDGAGCVECAA